MKAYMRDVLGKAKQGNFAIPATNFIDWNSAKAYVEMSEELNLPLILAFAQVHSPYLSLEEAASIGKYFQKKAKTPVVLHLDHGQDLAFIKRAIQLGFNSVMIDASLDSFEENVRKTKEVVEIAHEFGVDVEAEIGFVGANGDVSKDEIKSIYTNVEDAEKFVQETTLVFGSEGNGISSELLEKADDVRYIESLGSTRSLNVGVAAGVAMYEWVRQQVL